MERYKNFLTPGAILVAGIMISWSILAANGAIIFPKEGLGAQAAQQPGDTENTGEKAAFGPDLFQKLAQDMGLNMDQYTACVAERKYKDKVEEDYQEGIRLGVNGTPGSFVNSQPVRGALPYEQVKAIIDAEIASGNTALLAGLEVAEDDHVQGNPSAPITLVEFSDFQCPFCKRFHPTVEQIFAEYGDQVKWVYKHFPLDQIHPQARPAAEASECIAEQKGEEGFWQFADAVFKAQ